MYLHLGDDCVVRQSDIIGIFDIENTSVTKDTRLFLSAASKRGQERDINFQMPKAFVLCQSNGESRVYISPISVQTLKKRAEKNKENPLQKKIL